MIGAEPRQEGARQRRRSLVDDALELAAAGWPVFPCGQDKRPIVEHGFLDASLDANIIVKIFSRPRVVMIGVPCGPASGFDVLDLDPRHGSETWEADNVARLPETQIHQTTGGGRHYLFVSDQRVRNSSGRIAPGVDVRGLGGYIIAPPTPGYTIVHEVFPDLANWPEFLLQPGLAIPKPPPARPVRTETEQRVSDRRLEGFRRHELAKLNQARDGQKHYLLRNTALLLGGLLHEGQFTEADSVGWLLEALPGSVKDWKLAERTAMWGIAAGAERPIKLEDRPEYASRSNGAGNHKANGSTPPPNDPPPGHDQSKAEPPPHDADLSAWPYPVDFLTSADRATPTLRPDHLPDALWPFVTDTAERMGVDPVSVALGCLTSCATVISEQWQIQPKRYDYGWLEGARLWAAILGPPSILKTPIIRACTRAIDKLEIAARQEHKELMATYDERLAEWEAGSKDDPRPSKPQVGRWVVEDSTVEAISEVLRGDDDGEMSAPSGKIMVRQDEMSEFFARLDRYNLGKGGGDRGTYLRLYNGGRSNIDRIGRGSFVIPSWAATFLGGIQPGPLQQIARAAVEDGLLQRFFFAVPSSQAIGVDRCPNKHAIDRYERLFPILARYFPAKHPETGDPQPVLFHEDAQQHRLEIEASARALAALPDTSPRLHAAFGKWPGQFSRLALTFHLIEIADQGASLPDQARPFVGIVREATARRAAAFMMDIILPHLLLAEAIMFSSTQSTHARWIAGYILSHRCDVITSREQRLAL
jgi:hypothetical protein